LIGPILERSKPVFLDIPSIDVHSVVQYLGQAADGTLEAPAGDHYNEAAWYRYSPTPGSLGPAILLGHVDSAAEGPSVFFRLGELRPGDRVSITRADDSIAVFVVDTVQSYSKDDFPTEVVYRDIDHAGLRIITCGGAFDNSTGHYLDNIVVFASLAGSPEE
jgi:sortase (surface protein transpeptidase)